MNPVTSYLSLIGRKGGKAKSKAKTEANRKNGAKRWAKRNKFRGAKTS